MLIPCIFLNHNKDSINSAVLKTHTAFSNVMYWERKIAGGSKCVQFCNKNNSRINSVFDCYEKGFKDCYKIKAT